MATTKSVSFTCPNCEKVLRAGSRPAAGKKIKCPACAHAFIPDLDEEEEKTSIQDKPRLKKAPPRDEDDDKPRNRKSRADEDDDDRPSRKRSRDDDDDDRGSRKKKKEKKSGGGMMMILVGLFLVGGFGLFACAGCGVGAWWFWPGKDKELAAFLPPDANIVMGGNPKLLKAKMPNLERAINRQIANAGQGEDVTLRSEKMLAFGKTSDVDGDDGLVSFFQSTSSDITSVKRNPKAGAAQTIGGHSNIHRVTPEGKRDGMSDLIAFPGGNIIATANGNEKNLLRALDQSKKPIQVNAALTVGKSLDKAPFWVVILPTADDLAKIRREMEMPGEMATPQIRAAAPAVNGVKEFTLTLDVGEKEELKLNANIRCANDADAVKIKAAGESIRNLLAIGFQAMAFMPPQPGMPRLGPTVAQDWSTLAFNAQGANVTATMRVSSQTIEELVRIGMDQRNGFVGGPPPPKFDGGPKDFPKFDGGPKDFPKFDGGPKDFPKFDGGPKDFPKFDGFKDRPKLDGVMKDFPKIDGGPKTGKGKLIQTFSQKNIQPNTNREGVFQFQKGKRITITMTSVTKGNTDVDLYVLRGVAGENIVAADASVGPNGNVNFIVPETDQYRVQIRNLGQGVATSSTVRIYEQ